MLKIQGHPKNQKEIGRQYKAIHIVLKDIKEGDDAVTKAIPEVESTDLSWDNPRNGSKGQRTEKERIN